MTLVVYYLCLTPEDAHTLLTMLPPIKKHSPISSREQSSDSAPSSACVSRLGSESSWYSCFTRPASTISSMLGSGELWLDELLLTALPVPLLAPPSSSSRAQYSAASPGVSGRSNSRPSGSVVMSSRSLRVVLEPVLPYERLCTPSSPVSSGSWVSCWCRCTSAYRLSRCFFDMRPNFTAMGQRTCRWFLTCWLLLISLYFKNYNILCYVFHLVKAKYYISNEMKIKKKQRVNSLLLVQSNHVLGFLISKQQHNKVIRVSIEGLEN